jgi:GTP cyclohydrolase I
MESNKRLEALQTIIEPINQYLDDEVKENTPNRFIKAFDELTKGYSMDVEAIIGKALFDIDSSYSEMIVVDKIDFNSLCQHHLLPFVGKCSIGYIPDKKILGLSKFARVVEAFSLRLSLQEKLTLQIAEALQNSLKAKGVIVYIESTHSCMCLRGVKSKCAITKTVYTTGCFKDVSEYKSDFFRMVKE